MTSLARLPYTLDFCMGTLHEVEIRDKLLLRNYGSVIDSSRDNSGNDGSRCELGMFKKILGLQNIGGQSAGTLTKLHLMQYSYPTSKNRVALRGDNTVGAPLWSLLPSL